MRVNFRNPPNGKQYMMICVGQLQPWIGLQEVELFLYSRNLESSVEKAMELSQ